jgi:rubrerythrin
MSKTEDYLREAFAGESQANRRYLAFAEMAEKEGFKQAARLFKAAAEAETIHAIAHLKALKAIHSTKDNLKEAIGGETHEYTKMYPEMLEAAKTEGNNDAFISFYRANEVEKIHAELYQGLFDGLGKDQENYPYYVCPVCGYTVGREAPDACPICATKKDQFKKIQ